MNGQVVQLWRRVAVVWLLSASMIAVIPAFAANTVPVAETPARVTELIARIVEAYGGRDALTNVSSIYARGFCKLYQQGNDGWITRYAQHPRKLRVEASYHYAPETRILNDKKGWMGVGTAGQKEADRYAFEGLVFQYDYMNLPFNLIAGANTITYEGKDTTGGAPVDVLLVKGRDGEEMTLYVDEKTHLIAKVSSPITAPVGRTEVAVEFFDYRDVGGVKMPFRVISSFGPAKVGITNMTEVVINRAMDDKLFQPAEIPPKK